MAVEMEPAPQELLQGSWRNKVPVRLTLAQDSISSPTNISPLYFLVPRLGYLSSLATQAWPHVQHVLPSVPGASSPRPWFDYQGIPLKWWLPIGVLYDLLASNNGPAPLPWQLQMHYTALPAALAGWDNGAPMQSQFFHSLKEAGHICRGTEGSCAVMMMAGAAQDALWAAVERGDGTAVVTSVSALKLQPAKRQGQPPCIPVRLLLRHSDRSKTNSTSTSSTNAASSATSSNASSSNSGGNESAASTSSPQLSSSLAWLKTVTAGAAGAAGSVSALSASAGAGATSWDGIHMTSRPVPTTTPTGEPLTLGRLLSYLLPVLFPSPDVPTAVVPAAAAPDHVADSGASTSGAVAAKASGASAAHRPNSLPHSASSSVQLQGTAADGGASPSASLQEAASASSMPSGSNSRLDGDTGGSTATATARDKIAGGLGEEGGIGGKAGSRSDGSDVGVKQQQLQPAAFHPLSAEVQQQTHGTNTAVCEMTQGGTSGTTSRSESPAGQASSSPTHQPAARSLSTATAAAAPGEGSALGAAVLPSTNSSSLGSSSEAQAATNTTCATPSTPAGFTHGACSHSPSTAAPPNAAAPCTQTMEGVGMSAGWSACWPKCRVVVAGIEPPLHAPLSWLHASLQSADTFLYVVVRMDV